MNTRYPILLVHGVAVKEFRFIKSFAGIADVLEKAGNRVYPSETDGFGTIENNATQLKEQVLEILAETGAERVNLIAHSKGGLDARYMIEHLGMEDYVASLTTLCTPHHGSHLATWLWRLPRWMRKFIAFWINLWYRIFGDKHPDALTVCRQLQTSEEDETGELFASEKVYCQSYSATMHRGRDDFLMSIPFAFIKYWAHTASDGLVTADSAKFGDYRGDALDGPVSHTEIIGFCLNKKKRERIHAFYLELAEELALKDF